MSEMLTRGVAVLHLSGFRKEKEKCELNNASIVYQIQIVNMMSDR